LNDWSIRTSPKLIFCPRGVVSATSAHQPRKQVGAGRRELHERAKTVFDGRQTPANTVKHSHPLN